MEEEDWTCPQGTPGTSGDFLRRFRDQLRLTQQEMADKAGVDRALIAKIESGRDARVGTLAKIIDALGGRLFLGVRSPRSLKDMAEDHVAARQTAWELRARRKAGAISPSSTGSPS